MVYCSLQYSTCLHIRQKSCHEIRLMTCTKNLVVFSIICLMFFIVIVSCLCRKHFLWWYFHHNQVNIPFSVLPELNSTELILSTACDSLEASLRWLSNVVSDFLAPYPRVPYDQLFKYLSLFWGIWLAHILYGITSTLQ